MVLHIKILTNMDETILYRLTECAKEQQNDSKTAIDTEGSRRKGRVRGVQALRVPEHPSVHHLPEHPDLGSVDSHGCIVPEVERGIVCVASGAPLKRKACLRVETRAVSCHCHKVALRMCLIARPCKRGTAEARLSRSAPETTRRCKANSRDGRTE
nr:hypothetical protein Iba_chr14fCG4030 [Ipomoea batatas]